MTADALDHWRDAAAALPDAEVNLGLPFDVFLGEAIDVAKFHAKYWKARRDDDERVVFPGLELAVGKGKLKKKLTSKTGEEIRSLQAAARYTDTLYQFALAPPTRAPADEGRKVLGKIVGALEWALDDGVEDDNDTKLANLHSRHGDATSNDALASALEAYAALADEVRELLESFETFDAEQIDRAPVLAEQLRESPQSRERQGGEAARALELRDRICKLLQQRVRLVRGAAGFVFQDYPEVKREVSSAYERRRRAASRKGPPSGGSGAGGGDVGPPPA